MWSQLDNFDIALAKGLVENKYGERMAVKYAYYIHREKRSTYTKLSFDIGFFILIKWVFTFVFVFNLFVCLIKN